MAIPNLNPPYPDLPNGYTVTDAEWNGQFNSIFNYCNGTLKPAIDALQAAPPPEVGAQAFFNARLTLESGVPISAANQANKSTLFLTPFGGNLLGLYDDVTDTWSNYPFTEISIGVPASTKQLYDVFARQISGICSLELGGYKTITASNSPTAGKDKVINIVSTADVVVGDVISVVSAGGAEDALVTQLVTNTSITVDWLEFSHTTPVLGLAVPTNALALQDGIPVKASDPTRRYCGTFSTLASGQTSDIQGARLVANYYNRVQRDFLATPTNASWATSLTGAFPLGEIKTPGEYRCLFINPSYGYTSLSGTHGRGSNGQVSIGIKLNNASYGAVDYVGGTLGNSQADEDDTSFTHGFAFSQTKQGRMILQPMGSNPSTTRTYNNWVSFGGTTHRIGHVTGTVLN